MEGLERYGGKQSTKRTFAVSDLKWLYCFEQVIIIDFHGALGVQIFM